MIDGVVSANTPAKGATVIVGSPVRGRIRGLESYTDPFPYFVVALEFTEVELRGIRHRFYADVVDIESAPGVEQTLSTRNKTEFWTLENLGSGVKETKETLWFYNLPGVATFFFRGGKLDLPQGFRTVWKTRRLSQ